MKRYKNLYQQIIDPTNLQVADYNASKGKSKQPGVIHHKLYQDANLEALHAILVNKCYKTSKYATFKVYEPKEREVYKLPYYPDRIMHHAIMNVLEPIFTKLFTADTYSCIKGRGIHGALKSVKKALIDVRGTQYCLKMDVAKFYPSVDHNTLKTLLMRKFKDADLLSLLNEIIDSAPGLPIGNYLSQYFANFYLTGFDHWIKEQMKAKYYFRYTDDLVILSGDKKYLHQLRYHITEYLQENLQLSVKKNYQVFPVAARGIDFVGYRFFHTHTLLRKSIKQNYARMMASNPTPEAMAAYKGWTAHCNSYNLTKKLSCETI